MDRFNHTILKNSPKNMTKEEWTRSLIVKLASGHMNFVYMKEAQDWLQGKDPPEKWEPKAKKEFEIKRRQ